ncbi:MAG: hypothetical protein KAW12_25010 [Candidatus Aminicenantes bacterium]|nr:hypothetical protein [Candidatus Aminicenantes bacterium]
MKCWKPGILGLEDWKNGILTNNYMECYYSIIPGWNKQNGWLGILYYQ